jgi:hypothetical protein
MQALSCEPTVPHVKKLRVVILVLLALLLPIRGAVAAAMLCPGDGSAPSSAVAVEQVHVAMPVEHGLDEERATAHHHSSDGAASDHDASVSDGHPTACQLCASGCCLTPLAFAPPSVQARVLTTSAVSRALTLNIPDFESGGQDRPPRTI